MTHQTNPAHFHPPQPIPRHVHARLLSTLAIALSFTAPPALAGPLCTADWDANGEINAADAGAFLSDYFLDIANGTYTTDLDRNGTINASDVGSFLTRFFAGCTAGIPVPAELAGEPLPAYPHFNFVNAFNAGSPVSLAVDPAAHPHLVNRTANVFIVRHRSAQDWLDDPVLIDARPANGPDVVTFFPGTITQNTFTLADSHTLPATGETILGAAYDLVIDADRNGLLSDPDLIDGLGDEPAFRVLPNLTALGPLTRATPLDYPIAWEGIPASRTRQRVYFPEDIANLGPLPLVVISHGNGHSYNWYDYLQAHLASWGFVVLSHQNDTIPGVEYASSTTLLHTEAFLALLSSIGGGVLDGHVDASRIFLIGHSRGGEGVVRAFDRLLKGEHNVTQFAHENIRAICSIAPTDFLGPDGANPHHANFHLLYGAADGDVCGCPDADSNQPFHILERALGQRSSTYVHGASHNNFNCCGLDDFVGPPDTAIGRPEAHDVAKAAILALADLYLNNNLTTQEFLWRSNERFRAPGIAPSTTIDREFCHAATDDLFVIDDFQTNPESDLSSSGAPVSFDVLNLIEGRLDDTNNSFTWTTVDPHNGMTRARPEDAACGVAFDWPPGLPRFYELAILPGRQDFSEYTFLQFRAAQGPRHPETVAELTDLSFTITLRDAQQRTSSISISAYGSAIEEPYQRTGFGTGAGWQTEFETVRIRLADFTRHPSVLDLTRIEALRLDFGGPYGSSRGRLALDDIYLSRD